MRMGDGEAHSLFLIYPYNPHDPDFNGLPFWDIASCFEVYLFEIQHNASPICAHCRATADTAMHVVVLSIFGLWKGRRFLSGWARCPWQNIRFYCQGSYLLRCVCLTALADFFEAIMRKNEWAKWEHQALKRQRALLACLRSDDDHAYKCLYNVHI